MTNKPFGIAEPDYDARRVRSSQSIAPDLGGGTTGGSGLENKIYVWHADGSTIDTFDPDAAGLTLAIAAAATGDTIWLPSISIALTAGVTIPASVTVRGIGTSASLSFSGFSGDGVTLSSGSVLQDVTVTFNGAGYATARGVVASGIGCTLIHISAYASNATTNTAIELSGVNNTITANAIDVYGEASSGTNAIGIRIGDFCHVESALGVAQLAATRNSGVAFACTSAANAGWFLSGYGYSTATGSAGMEVEAGRYANIVNGFARGVAAGLLIGAGAVALVYALQWSSLVNSGTLTLLPGSGAGTSGSMYFNVEDYGAVHDGATDDTAAIQAAIDAAAAAGGGVVYFPAGVYSVQGALQDGARGNAQLILPSVDTTGEQIGITLLGETLPGFVPSLTGSITTPAVTTLKSTLNSGAGGALLGGWGPVGSYQNSTLINLRIENLAFQMPSNPVLSALNLSHVEAVELVNVVAHTGTYQISAVTQPTTATSYGIVTPQNSNGAWTVLDGVLVVGFYNGYQINEHFTATMISAFACYYAAVLPVAGHATWIDRFLIQWSRNGLRFTGAQHILIGELNIEHHATTGAWYDPVYDVDDASNYGVGSIVYHVTISGTGADDPILVNGATGLHITSIHSAGAGGVTSIAAGTGIALTPNPIVATGTVALNATLDNLSDVNTAGEATGDILYDNAGTWQVYPLGIGTNIIVTSGKLRIGSTTNYLEIDKSTGNLRLVGSATQWDDIQPYYISGQGANVATTAQYGTTGFFWYKFTDTHAKDEELQFAFQIPHRAITAGAAHLHLHVVPSANGAGGNNTVVMRYSYQWVNINDTYSTTTNTAANVTFTVGASDANKHLLWELVDISGTGKTLSSDLVVIVSRQSKNGIGNRQLYRRYLVALRRHTSGN